MKRPSAVLGVAGDGDSYLAAAVGAGDGVLLAAIDEVESFHTGAGEAVGALGVEDEAGDVDVSSGSALLRLYFDLESEVGLSFDQGYINNIVL